MKGAPPKACSIDTPTVSVVVGVRDGGEHLEPSLSSILGQTGVALELIVVDDGSRDDTASALEALARTDPRVRVVHQEAAGLTRALIRGCAAARGEFIARHDADDISLSDRLRLQADLLRGDPLLGFVSCWSRAIGPRDETLWELTPPGGTEEATRRLVDELGGPIHGSVMMRRAHYEEVGGYRPEFYFAQDSDLWLRLVERGRFALVDRLGYEFRVSESSLTARYRRAQRRLGQLSRECFHARRAGRPEKALIERASALRPKAGDASRRGSRFAGSYFIGRSLLARRDVRAGTYLREAARLRPLDPRVWLSLAQLALIRFQSGRAGRR